MKGGTCWFMGLVVMLGMASCGKKEERGDERGKGGAEDEAQSFVLAREGHRLPVGATMVRSNALELTDAAMSLEQEGKKEMGTMTMGSESELRAEMVSETELRVVVEKDRKTVKHSVAGAPQASRPEVNPLEGLAVVLTLEDGSWSGELEEGEASEKQQEKMKWLAQQFSNEDAINMYGSALRQVGEEWEIDPKNASFLSDGAEFEGTYRLRFDRVEEFEGQRCAVLTGTIDVTGKPDARSRPKDQMKITARATIYRSLDHLETLSAEFAGEFMRAEYLQPGDSVVVRGPLRILQRSVVRIP